MLEHLNKVNDVKVYSVFDAEFKPYGRVVDGYDFQKLAKFAQRFGHDRGRSAK